MIVTTKMVAVTSHSLQQNTNSGRSVGSMMALAYLIKAVLRIYEEIRECNRDNNILEDQQG
jgi:hypothetical protein